MADNIEFTFGQNDSAVVSRNRAAWKAEKDREYLITLAWFKGIEQGTPDWNSGPKFEGGYVNWVDKAGYVVAIDGPEYAALTKNEPPKQKLATIIAVWPIDGEGQLDTANLAKVSLRTWSPGVDKYELLKKINRSNPLNQTNLMVSLQGNTEVKFQKLNIVPAGASILKKIFENDKAKPLADKIAKGVAACMAEIQDCIGKKYTIQQLREKLGVDGASDTSFANPSMDGLDAAVNAILDL